MGRIVAATGNRMDEVRADRVAEVKEVGEKVRKEARKGHKRRRTQINRKRDLLPFLQDLKTCLRHQLGMQPAISSSSRMAAHAR
jgi:hypothetical protein